MNEKQELLKYAEKPSSILSKLSNEFELENSIISSSIFQKVIIKSM